MEDSEAQEAFDHFPPSAKYHVFRIIDSWFALKAMLSNAQLDIVRYMIRKSTTGEKSSHERGKQTGMLSKSESSTPRERSETFAVEPDLGQKQSGLREGN